MSEQDPSTKPQFLRRVTFLDLLTDQPDASGPVHVGQRVLLDGVAVPTDVIDLTGGWSVSNSGLDGTVVSFSVNADHIKPMIFADSVKPGAKAALIENGGWIDGPWIAGHRVATPVGSPWEEYQPCPRTDLTMYGLIKPRMVRVYFFAAEVEIRAARPGEIESPRAETETPA